MAYDDPTIARVCKNGYRILPALEPGMRSKLDRLGYMTEPYPTNPIAPRDQRVTQARKVAGYTS